MALINCNLCGQKISSRARFCPKCNCPALPWELKLAQKRDVSNKRTDKIDSLSISSELKEQFKLIADSKLRKVVIGIPLFDSDDARLRLLNLGDPKRSIISLPGLCLGPLYYLGRGMWKKGAAIVILFVVIAGLLTMMSGDFGLFAIAVAAVVIQILSAVMVKYDYYRKMVLDLSFWW